MIGIGIIDTDKEIDEAQALYTVSDDELIDSFSDEEKRLYDNISEEEKQEYLSKSKTVVKKTIDNGISSYWNEFDEQIITIFTKAQE